MPTSAAPPRVPSAPPPGPPAPPDALLQRTRAQLSRALTTWATLSVLFGAALWLLGVRTSRSLAVGVGRQAVAWGAVDLVIAVAGMLDRRAVTDAPSRVRSLRRLLLLNAGLDVGYLVAAVVLARRRPWRADAVGVVPQAVALLVIDLVHARRLGRR